VRQEYIYSRFNRIWHWLQAALIIFLATTGFEIHGSLHFFGFEHAVRYHNGAAMALLGLLAFAIFWHFTTGQWRQYWPTLTRLREQALYYVVGIFQNAPHPTQKSAANKLNPLQRLVYLGLKLALFPAVIASGLLYMFHRYPQRFEILSLKIGGLSVVALVHTAGAYLMVTFLIAHLYLITTGSKLTTNLKAMITGYEDIEHEPGSH
jgi:thiosulfate reductase cytochrome b subunit